MAKFGTKIWKGGARGYKARVEEQENHQLSNSLVQNMSSIHGSPVKALVTDSVHMDIDSDSEAEQAAREFTQAQEQLRITNEARERRQEEWKGKEEEEKEWQWIAAIEAARKVAEEILERERQAQLQVSTGVLRN